MKRTGTFRDALDVLLQGRTGIDAGLHLWRLVTRLTIVAVFVMAAIAVLLALEPGA